MSTLAGFLAKVERFPSALSESMAEASLAAGENVKEAWLGIAAGAGLRPGQPIRNLGRQGARWGVSYKATKAAVNADTLVRFSGPVAVLVGAEPTKPHVIVARRRGGRAAGRRHAGRVDAFRAAGSGGALAGMLGTRAAGKSGGALALSIGGSLRAYAHHPGSKRSNIWPACVEAANRLGPATYQSVLPGSLVRAGFGR